MIPDEEAKKKSDQYPSIYIPKHSAYTKPGYNSSPPPYLFCNKIVFNTKGNNWKDSVETTRQIYINFWYHNEPI